MKSPAWIEAEKRMRQRAEITEFMFELAEELPPALGNMLRARAWLLMMLSPGALEDMCFVIGATGDAITAVIRAAQLLEEPRPDGESDSL